MRPYIKPRVFDFAIRIDDGYIVEEWVAKKRDGSKPIYPKQVKLDPELIERMSI